ncbi:MAG TPA: hypothetical protein VNA24_11880 [Hyalangium sp.]|nr:hypothetical protein [Hyalangium sp.]
MSRVVNVGGPAEKYWVGALLFGKVIPGGGDHFFIRYEEAQLAGSTERVPVCAVLTDPDGPGPGLPKEEGSTDTEWNSFNGAPVRFVNFFNESTRSEW